MASSTPQKGKPIPVKWLLPLSLPLGPGNDLSISTSLPILNISYKWVMEHMTFMSFFVTYTMFLSFVVMYQYFISFIAE